VSFPRYPNYKPSGVEWLGDVPAHWNVDRLKRSLTSCQNGIWGEEPRQDENDIPCVRVADFDRQRLRVELYEPTIRNVTEKERAGRVLGRGDLLIEKSGGGESQPVGVVVLYDDTKPAVCSNFLARVKLAEGMNASFWRFVHAAAYAVRLNARSIKQTSGIQNLDASQYFDERAGFPPLDEQARIAAFLDAETAKIDALVAEQQRLLELLKEKRRAVISHAVTRGLNSNAPLKPSGIEWLGDVPTHWTQAPIRFYARLESGHTPSRNHPEYWEDCQIPWFSLADVWQIRREARRYITETAEMVSDLGIQNSAARVLPKGTVMLSRTASVGFSAIMDVPMATTQDFANWVCGPALKPEFLLYVFSAMKGEFRRLMMGSTHNTIYMPDIAAMRCGVPPIAEQEEIVRYLDRQTEKLDELAATAERSVDLLRERRIALISAAVTGQIDVRVLSPRKAV